MQEFTRIIGSIYHTGISSANCFVFRVIYYDNVFTHVHVYVCALNYMYGKQLVKVYSSALNMFTLARFHLGFGNILVINNRWLKTSIE